MNISFTTSACFRWDDQLWKRYQSSNYYCTTAASYCTLWGRGYNHVTTTAQSGRGTLYIVPVARLSILQIATHLRSAQRVGHLHVNYFKYSTCGADVIGLPRVFPLGHPELVHNVVFRVLFLSSVLLLANACKTQVCWLRAT